MHAMESILHAGWTLHLPFRGDLSSSEGTAGRSRGASFFSIHQGSLMLLEGIKLAQVNGV